MKKLQLGSGMIMMVFAAFICFEASKLPFGTLRNPGPGFLPLGYGVILFFLATIFAIKSGFEMRTAKDPASGLWQGLKWKEVPYILASLLGYALLLDRFGYIICTGVLMILLFWGKGTRRNSIAIVGGLVVSIGTYIFFKVLLKVQLPSGWIGI